LTPLGRRRFTMHGVFLHNLETINLAVDSASADTIRGLLAYLAVTQMILLLLIIFACILTIYIILLKREIRKLKGIGDGLSQALWAHRRDKMRSDTAPKKKAIHDRVRKALFTEGTQAAKTDEDEEAAAEDETPPEKET